MVPTSEPTSRPSGALPVPQADAFDGPSAARSDRAGSVEVYLPRPDVCITVARGMLSIDNAHFLMDTISPHFSEAGFAYFHDWENLQGYEFDARTRLTTWAVANLRYARSCVFLVSSRMVSMGIAVANIGTSAAGLKLSAHRSREAFLRAISRTLASERPGPTSHD